LQNNVNNFREVVKNSRKNKIMLRIPEIIFEFSVMYYFKGYLCTFRNTSKFPTSLL
jgi:hypothetical protein